MGQPGCPRPVIDFLKECLAKFVCTRWLSIINNDIQQTRETGKLGKHLPALDSNNPQPPDAQCPSQKRWPIQCCCVERSSSRNFRVPADPAIALVPSKKTGEEASWVLFRLFSQWYVLVHSTYKDAGRCLSWMARINVSTAPTFLYCLVLLSKHILNLLSSYRDS